MIRELITFFVLRHRYERQVARNYYITNRSSISIRSCLDQFARDDKTQEMHRSRYFRHPREPFFARGMYLHTASVGSFTLYC